MPDPPLEITWFYSAVTFHTSKKSAAFTKTIPAKDLFHLLISCSGPPLDIICEFSRNGLCLTIEIKDLFEKIVDYKCICLVNPKNGNEFNEDIVCLEELVGVWMVDRVGKCAKLEENLRVFVPIVSVDVHEGQKMRCGIRELAGIVMCEVFLLTLSLKCNMSHKEITKFIANSVTRLDEQYWQPSNKSGIVFYGALGGYLSYWLTKIDSRNMHPRSSEDAIVLQKLLYDAVILVDHSFLSSGRWFQQPESYFRNLFLLWSLVADNAILFARVCDQDTLTAYVKAFSESQLPSELLKWVSIHALSEENLSNPKLMTPKALIKWLFVLEDRGLRKFAFQGQIAFSLKFSLEAGLLKREHREGKCIGDEEMDTSLDKTFFDAYVCTDKLPTDGGRKRKDRVKDTDIRGGTLIKLLKYNVHESPNREKFLPFSDEDMEVMG
ncbi:putative transcription factor MYB39-like [Capsicum annuum]|nr:putative transcription factor MYB39-like [Capsicum annuum]